MSHKNGETPDFSRVSGECIHFGHSRWLREEDLNLRPPGYEMKAGLVWCYLVVSVHNDKAHESLDTLSFSCLVVFIGSKLHLDKELINC